jgi:hypothetical protein
MSDQRAIDPGAVGPGTEAGAGGAAPVVVPSWVFGPGVTSRTGGSADAGVFAAVLAGGDALFDAVLVDL